MSSTSKYYVLRLGPLQRTELFLATNSRCHGLVAASFDVVVGGVPQLGNGLMLPRAAGMGGNTLAVQTAMNQLDSCGKAYSNLSSPMEPLPFSFDRMIQGRVIKDREAYTMELGPEVQKLKEMNQELKRKHELDGLSSALSLRWPARREDK
ncbi:hypothetical protein U9M48_019914 [Paspalum notatum var. saurae]|uniref:Uncharacterized protein n=1 Tax=Paspalum notatum var. saurae TaxID=547442 RepID=A0AAQ3TGI5_PASNO